MKRFKNVLAAVILMMSSSLIASAQQATVAPWQIHKGNEGVLDFFTTFNGDPRAYSKMNIPAISDKGWETAPVNSQNEVSINWHSELPCNQQIDFTYFQTFVNIPDNYNLSTANISYNKADDGARIYIFNSKYPNGIFDANADITIHQKNSGTVDFKDKLAKGENRIVIVQFDDCGYGNSLEGIKISLNGQRVIPAEASTLNFGNTLAVGQKLTSKNGQYSLGLNSSGSLCLYNAGSQVIWSSGTTGGTRCKFDFNGDLLIYDNSNRIIWSSNTGGKGCTKAMVEDSGDFGLFNAVGSKVWSCKNAGNSTEVRNFNEVMGITQSLRVGGGQLISKNGQYNLIIQPDGNICIYRNKTTFVWAAMTNGKGGERLTFNGDGNLCLYNANNAIVWETGTNKGAIRDVGALLILDDNGTLKLMSANAEMLWSNTGGLVQKSNSSGGAGTTSTGTAPAENVATQNSKNTLNLNQELAVSKYLVSNNGQYEFGLCGKGSLVMYKIVSGKYTIDWFCGKSSGSRVKLESNGNLVVYGANGASIWSTGTEGRGVVKAVMEDRGDLVLYGAGGQVVWSCKTGNAGTTSHPNPDNSRFGVGYSFKEGEEAATSADDQYGFGIRQGSFCVYKRATGQKTWSCGSTGGTRGSFDSNGDLVLYDGGGKAIWRSNTGGKGCTGASLDNSGDLILLTSTGQRVWTCKANGGNQGQASSGSTASSCEASASVKKYQNSMKPGEKLQLNEKIVSANGKYQFRITSDGNYIVEEILNSGSCSYREVYRFPIVNGGSRPSASYFSYNPDGNICMESSQGKGFCLTDGRDNMVRILNNSAKFELTDNGLVRLVSANGQEVWSSSSSNSGTTTTLADGQYRLWNQYTGSNKVLALNAEGQICIADKNESDDNQVWIISTSGNGYRRITNKAKGGNFSIDIINDGKNDQLKMAATGNYSGQAWMITSLSNGVFRLTTQWQTEKKSLDVLDIDNRKHAQLAASGNYTGQYWQFVSATNNNKTTGSTSNSTPAAPVALPTFFKLHAYSIHGKRVEKGSDFYMGFTNGSVDGKIINPNSGNVLQIEKVTIDAGKGIIALKIINAVQPDMYLSVNDNKNVTIVKGTSGNKHHFYVRTPEEKEAANLSYVSFESVAFPGWYLRHQGFVLKVSEGNEANRGNVVYRQDATWLFEPLK